MDKKAPLPLNWGIPVSVDDPSIIALDLIIRTSEMFPRKPKEGLRALAVLAANIFFSQGRGVKVPLGMKSYNKMVEYHNQQRRDPNLLISYRTIRALVDKLKQEGLIGVVLGKCKYEGCYEATSIHAKIDFYNVVASLDVDLVFDKPIICRFDEIVKTKEGDIVYPISKKTGKPLKRPLIRKSDIPYEILDFPEILAMSEEVERINTVNRSFSVMSRFEDFGVWLRSVTDVRRIYFVETILNGSKAMPAFNLCGRFYGGANSFQHLSKEQRRGMLIDGLPVCELDYKSCQISILYSTLGLPTPEECYIPAELKRWFNETGVSAHDISKFRGHMKTVLLSLLNSCSENQSVKSVRSLINKTISKDSKQMSYVKRVCDGTAEGLLDCFVGMHLPLQKHFNTACCKRLQHIESNIAFEILKDITGRGLPCLCIHDSFITFKKDEESLHSAMRNKFYEMLGFYPTISVEF